MAVSAVVSVSTSGVCPTGMPRAVQAATSMLSTPTASCEITRNCRSRVQQGRVDLIDQHAEEALGLCQLLQQKGAVGRIGPGNSKAGCRMGTAIAPRSGSSPVTTYLATTQP